jgi:hypothetical protein
VHYTAGVGTAFSFAGGSLVPGQGLLSTVARLLLDGAGALFGLYLLLAVGLSTYGRALRRRGPGRQVATGLPRPAPARLPGPASPSAAPPAGAAAPGAAGATAGAEPAVPAPRTSDPAPVPHLPGPRRAGPTGRPDPAPALHVPTPRRAGPAGRPA